MASRGRDLNRLGNWTEETYGEVLAGLLKWGHLDRLYSKLGNLRRWTGRIYFARTASDLCPVCSLICHVGKISALKRQHRRPLDPGTAAGRDASYEFAKQGMLLSIPTIVIVKIMSQHVEQLQPLAKLLGE